MRKRTKIRFAGTILMVTLMAGCNAIFTPETIPAPTNVDPAPVSQIRSYAKAFLNEIQPVSIAESREYCGFFVGTPDGNVIGTDPIAGTADGCYIAFIPENVVASYHTHGGYLPGYFNELPSVNDAEGAFDAELDDYLSTPGGRFWRIDGQTGISQMLCGRSCLTDDPTYRHNPRNPGRDRYTIEELETLQS
ncbi:DUF4329 domain-containing protein [Yoonia sp. 2307UL14-13]|uniref:DUF4329 domain-containing protein n=1 Tax=Yoonia sp. 2307UL14-13 TaxID=3126506 RepID=UPI0030AC687E